MIDILPAPDHVFAVRVSGTVTGEDFDRVVGEIETKLNRHERIGVFMDAIEFDDMTAEAAAKDIRYGLSKFGELKRFPRDAVVTDKRWLRTLVKIADPLLPHVEARTFTPVERAQALTWVSEVNPS